MKRFTLSLMLLFALSQSTLAQTNRSSAPSNNSYQQYPNSVNSNTTQVRGYVRKDGTYVLPYERTSKNSTNWDNYSTTNNTNPNTQEQGSRAKDYTPDAYNYGQGKTIYEGPKGGQYYINDNGKKVYVPKRN